MLHGAFALLERSLRVDSRAWATHLSRLGLMGAIYCSLCFALTTSFMFGAPGLHFFRAIAYLDATFITLLGIGFFSTSITEEKEEDTLGLMLMAGISPLGILLGKSGGRLWQSLLLVAVQYPFVLLAVTMGGVMGTQIWSVTVSLLAYIILLSGFGLLCSTLAPRSQYAATWMVIGLCVYFFVPLIAKECLRLHSAWILTQKGTRPDLSLFWPVVEFISEVCVLTQMSDILVTSSNEATFSIQVISNVLLGVACACLSWLFFGIATRDPSTEATTRGLVVRLPTSPFSTGVQSYGPKSFRLHPCTWRNPFIWKDFHFIAGGAGMLLVRIILFGGMALFMFSIEAGPMNGYWQGWFYCCNFLLWLSVTIDAARVLSRSMQEEVRGQTLTSLIMLPCSPNHMVYSKFAGALMGWLPGLLIASLVNLFSPQLRQDLSQMVKHNAGGLVLTMMVLYFALIPHFAALLSLYVRWGAVSLAIGITIGLYFVAVMIVVSIRLIFGAGTTVISQGSEYVILSLLIVALLVMIAACHFGVLLRFQALAAK